MTGVTGSAVQGWRGEGECGVRRLVAAFPLGRLVVPAAPRPAVRHTTKHFCCCGVSRPCAEPLCAALPERQVAQATKAETSLRTPKSARCFKSHPSQYGKPLAAFRRRGAFGGNAKPVKTIIAGAVGGHCSAWRWPGPTWRCLIARECLLSRTACFLRPRPHP